MLEKNAAQYYAPPTNAEPVECLQADEFNQLLHRIGNHEGKTAIAAILMRQPDVTFKPSELRTKVDASQGDKPGWVPSLPVFKSYCKNSLEPAGIITAEHDGRYQVVQTALLQRLAFCGSVLSLSLDFPNTSVQKVLSLSSAGQEYQSTKLKYDICKVIAENNGHEMSCTDVEYQINDNTIRSSAVRATISALADLGILTTHRLDVSTDTRLGIIDPNFHEGKGRILFEELNPATRLAYLTFGTLSQQGKQVISFEDFREQALIIEPGADQLLLRRSWTRALNKSSNFPGLKRVERTIKDPAKLSNVRINPNHAEAVQAIVELGNLQTDPDKVYKDWKFATAIVNNELAMAKIFSKARRFSAHFAKQEEGSSRRAERIFSIVRTSGTTDIRSVLATLHDAGQPLSRDATRKYLDRLVAEGKLVKESRHPDPSSRRSFQYYTAAPEQA